jgi:hypothetical protein
VVPVLLKDLICASAGDPICMGMRLLRDACFVAPRDTYLASKFKAAGFICLGKPKKPALNIINMQAKDGVWLMAGFEANGQVWLGGAKIGGTLGLRAGHFINPATWR